MVNIYKSIERNYAPYFSSKFQNAVKHKNQKLKKNFQDKARAEVCAIFEESGGKIGIAELQKMPYLEQCIKESMRLYPIAATIFRYSIGDIKISKQ